MLALPIPLIVALVLAFLVLRAWLSEELPGLFRVLVMACALQGLLVSLVQHYGFTGLQPLQPITATVVPPLAWVAFQHTARTTGSLRHSAVHVAMPVITTLCVLFVPAAVDLTVPFAFLAYGAAILRTLRQDAGGLPLAPLEAGDLPGRVWLAIGGALILSAVSDALISGAHIAGAEWLQSWIVSVFSSLWLLTIGALSLSRILKPAAETAEETAVAPEPGPPDLELLERLRRLLDRDRLYLDPDLTLARLARRLSVPTKQLSAAVNRGTGGNVSRFINGFRIRHACARLAAGASVTAAMLESGFNTKSNFNREFLRVTGSTPSAWLAREVRQGTGP